MKKKQSISVKGVKFFQKQLDLLKAEQERSPLPASSLALYILMHLKCDDLGRIKGKEFSLSDFQQGGIPYTTLHTGKMVLLERGLIREIIINDLPSFEIVGYKELNSPEHRIEGEKLSYFRIPYELLTKPLLKCLVSAREAAGILLVLDLLNRFTRFIGKNQAKAMQASFTYTMKSLQEKTKKTALKIRHIINLIQDFFSFEACDYKERRPNKERVTVKKKNVIQIVIKKFKVCINPDLLLIEEDEHATKTLEAAFRKELTVKLESAGISYHSKELRDMLTAVKQEVINVMQFSTQQTFKERNRFIRNVFSSALDSLIDYYQLKSKENSNFTFVSIGSFMRKSLRSSMQSLVVVELDPGDRIEIASGYYERYRKYPVVFSN